MSNRWNISRRTALKGLGASLALPHLDVMSQTARAGEVAGPPLRFLAVFQPNGVYPKAWDVTGEGSEFTLSTILEPLAPVKDDLLVISHLDNVGTNGHVQMTGSFLTGVAMNGKQHAQSLDQMMAKKVGVHTNLPSVVLGTEPPRQGNAGNNPISFANTVSW
ncbi:MAG: DUF1552 domain-containing protein, partial [Planctomycetota bacterium]|nr:DUF1552 domain-containing protein [Planctomycetota bacterium]